MVQWHVLLVVCTMTTHRYNDCHRDDERSIKSKQLQTVCSGSKLLFEAFYVSATLDGEGRLYARQSCAQRPLGMLRAVLFGSTHKEGRTQLCEEAVLTWCSYKWPSKLLCLLQQCCRCTLVLRPLFHQEGKVHFSNQQPKCKAGYPFQANLQAN